MYVIKFKEYEQNKYGIFKYELLREWNSLRVKYNFLPKNNAEVNHNNWNYQNLNDSSEYLIGNVWSLWVSNIHLWQQTPDGNDSFFDSS
jgi:hypothetical protein